MQERNSNSIVQAIVGLVALAVLLTYFGGWALPVVIGAVIVMVMGHEFGHFITAKKSGMRVSDFFVGFGPVVWSKTIGETRYGIRALWLGGYVKVPGMSWTEEVDPALEARTYRASSFPRKVLFASAGSLMQFVMALVLAWASLTFVGQASPSHVDIAGFTKWDGFSKNAAQVAGLHSGDQIIAINRHRVTSIDALINEVHDSAGKRISLQVLREGKQLSFFATPVDGRSVKVEGQVLASGTHSEGFLGVSLDEMTVKDSGFAAVPGAFRIVGSTLKAAVVGIGKIFAPHEYASLFHQISSSKAATNPVNQQTRPESIVGVVRVAVQGSRYGAGPLLGIFIDLNLFVGVLNLLPILPLDGGYVAIAAYERLRSRRGNKYQANLNLMIPLVYGFVLLLGVLFLSTLYLDIVHPIANPF